MFSVILLGADLTPHARLLDLAPQTWYTALNTPMRAVCPPNGFGGKDYDFYDSCRNIIDAWSGGAYDTKRNRLIIWGGGHNDYYGNEIYVFDINRMQWQRLTDPDLDFIVYGPCRDMHASGRPVGRHTYDGLVYIEHADRFFAHGGSMACGPGSGSKLTWTFDFNTNTWYNMQPAGDIPDGNVGMTSAYDPATGLVYIHDTYRLFTYDFTANRYRQLTDRDYRPYDLVSTIDSKRRWLFMMGVNQFWYYNIGQSDYVRREFVTTGDTEIIKADAPGFKYDPVADCIVAWSGGKVYTLNLDTRVWTSINVANRPPGVPSSGNMFGRWQYIPFYNIFIAVTHVDSDVYFYKNTAGHGTNVAAPGGTAVPGQPCLSIDPNPVKSGSVLRINVSNVAQSTADIRLHIFNLGGQLIKECRVPAAPLQNGTASWIWDSRDEQGQPVASGIYLIVFSTDQIHFSQRVTVCK
jgi:hypothetical protein